MLCKTCKNEIPNGSIFCNWCGAKQIKEKKKKDEIKVPKPRQLGSGKFNIELKKENQSATFDTAEECIAWAKAVRAGFAETAPKASGLTLSQGIDKHISERDGILSPSTIRGYRIIQRNRFTSIMDKPMSANTNWQALVSAEAAIIAPKTLKNSWRFVTTVLHENGIQTPKVRLPQETGEGLPWLDYKQIKAFCKAIQGEPCELAALMALSSLRRSELCAVSQDSISKDCKSITVHGAKVPDEHHKYIIKETNKNVTSRRIVPVMIPRLEELLKARDTSTEYLITLRPDTLRTQINRVCEREGLPLVGVHGLRRSFVSLGYHLGLTELEIMQIGGWADFQTVHKHYLYLASLDKTKAKNKIAKFYSQPKNTNKNTNGEKSA